MKRTFRSRTALVLTIYTTFCALIMLPSLVSEVAKGQWTVVVVEAAAIVGLLAWVVAAGWKVGVEVNDDSVVLHGYLGAKRVSLRDVERFEMQHSWPYSASLIARDGARRTVLGLGASAVAHDKSMAASEALTIELNELVADWHRRNP